MADSDS